MNCEITDWIKQSCNFNWGKESCVGRAGSPLAAVRFCSGRNVLPRSSLQGCTSSFSFHCEPLLFTLHKKRGWKKKEKGLCIMQQIIPRTCSVVKKILKRQRKMQIWSFSYIFRRELYSSGVSLLAHSADISVHLIWRSLRSVQRFSVSSADFAPHWAGAAVVLINPGVMPVPRLWNSKSSSAGGAVKQSGLWTRGCPLCCGRFLMVNWKTAVCILKVMRKKPKII